MAPRNISPRLRLLRENRFTLVLGIALACNGPADVPDADNKPAQAGIVPHPSSLRFTQAPRPEGALNARTGETVAAPSPDSVVIKQGLIEFYDGDGRVRVTLLDAAARFATSLDTPMDPSLTPGERRPGAAPQIVVPLGGLGDWVARRTSDRGANDRDPSAELVVALGDRVRTMEAGLRGLPGELRELWLDTSATEEQRRRRLFERWDECEGGASIDPSQTPPEVLEIRDPGVALAMYRAHAGDRARLSIESFVREKLTKDGPHAYSESELAALNKTRKSPRRFAPYVALAQPSAPTPSGPLGAREGPTPPSTR